MVMRSYSVLFTFRRAAIVYLRWLFCTMRLSLIDKPLFTGNCQRDCLQWASQY
jgi:hypothetical protein